MGTYIDFSTKSVAELKNWILKQLGHPLITVELTDDQIEMAIDDAIEFYTEYADMQDNYVMLDLANYKENIGLSLSGYNVKSIFTLDENMTGGINTLFSVENQFANMGVFPYQHGGQQTFVTYELAHQFMDLAKRMLCQKFDFNYDVRNQRLKLWPDPVSQKIGGNIIVGVKTVPPIDELTGEHYVKRLALAKSKIILGLIRKKFDGVQLPGGGTIDSSVGDDGKDEWTKWTEEIINWTGPHNAFYIG